MNIKLSKLAEVLSVHPRTVLRALTGEPNPYWTQSHDPEVSYEDVCNAYNLPMNRFRRVLANRDTLLKPLEAAQFLEVPPRTFRYRKYPALIRKGGVVRFSKQDMVNESVARQVRK